MIAVRRARWAKILDHFAGVLPDHLARLTDRQIEELFFHSRDKDGYIRMPQQPWPSQPQEKKPMGVEEHVAAYRLAAQRANRRRPGAFPDDVVEAKVTEIRAHHMRKNHAAASSPGSADGVDGQPR